MQKRILIITLLFLVKQNITVAQSCSTLGQNPSTAFPVCGTKTFSQNIVPNCGGIPIPGPCGSDPLTDTNPFWYKFTCYITGTLQFIITPDDLTEDYDWQLFDITGRNPNDVYTDRSLFVACNWSGSAGLTGTSASGTSLENCAGFAFPTFSSMPVITQGHDYILLVSHFTKFNPSNKGYTLEFNGGTASITDPVIPSLKEAKPNCDSKEIVVKLGKKVTCNSIAINGSDFSLSPAIANVISVSSVNCSTGFDTDSLLVTLDKTIPAGNYSLVAKNGNDGNTLLDFCDNAVPVGQQVSFTVTKLLPTPIDSLVPVGCAPDKLVLVFKKNIQCASISPDGSDFFITGTSPVAIVAANGNCNANRTTSTIEITLSKPISIAGNFTITLKNGLDGNPIIDECGIPTPVGEGQSFTTKDTVNADFTYNINSGCKYNAVDFFHNGNNGTNNWQWTFANNGSSNAQNPQVNYINVNGQNNIQLIVSNGVCKDTSSQTITTNNQLTASFTAPDILCPEDLALFTDNSIGNVISWQWDFANGATANSKIAPPQGYPVTNSARIYKIELIAGDGICSDTAYRDITVVKSCYIAVPNIFTPNADNLNDFLYPLNAYKADNLEFKVYNRFGQLVFTTKDWTVKWDGTIKGNPQPTGTYAWYLKYTNRDTGKNIFLKGTTVLIR